MENSKDKCILKLFIAGKTTKSFIAVSNIKRLCEEELKGCSELVIIDVMEDPQSAEDIGILATPTLIREHPPPVRWIIGDLSDRRKVLIGLDIDLEFHLSQLTKEK